ncbi:non-heme iron oxygenase ferredoxin subunit [Paraburkholderia guartelaensis]|uniref:Non-heme iron oxygenase ferredoxin subunit n=1 Tax=Paraburkholderia guartelaensis TaxID=2546446 RepID=A0A4R5L5V2_9BURK|nr:non-heme iron oxygenase ferredoxin subunit [Paraburkholderia guartelaensis]TDG04136.1 non-heme iron oxygenase ferredoxin subunit [Paraburkholderia guartelaensis]
MANWVDVAPYAEFQTGSVRSVDVDGTAVAVFNLEGTCYAIEDTCPHDGGVLTGGDVEGDEVICPRHGARFCIKTGKVLAPPAYEDVAVFEVRVEAGIVQVRDSRWDEGFS